MRRPAILFLTALGLAGWVGADAAARSHGGGDGAAPGQEVLTGDVVVQRSAASADVVLAVDGGKQGEAADGIADRVFVLQRDGAPLGDAVQRYAGARVLFDRGNIVVAPAEGGPAVGLFLAEREALSPAAASFLGATPVGDRWTGRGIALRSGEVRVDAAGLSAATMDRILKSCGTDAARNGAARAARAAPPCPGGGSTDCSNSTCQVLCAPGYTACCDCTPDPTNCRCSCVRM
ncbi:MAG TPA: hypothetical protein VHG28_19620 [Longimicrobiaceae bacterium]|nr:hypothetical protein [Longimicrobiaceae bacterium]